MNIYFLLNRKLSVTDKLLPLVCLVLVFLIVISGAAAAQTRDLTVDVLINSANTTGFNTSPSSPGEFQRYPERYLEHFQVPYRLIDVSTTPPPDLTAVQLVIAGHRGLNLSSAWQQAIITAVQGGSGFVNLDWDSNIGSNAHMQAIFGATGSVTGTPGTSITLPATFLSDGATPHYITALQMRWPVANPASAFPADLVYFFHNDDNGVLGTATCTILLNGHGTVLAKIGSDPLLTVTTFGSGRAVNFGTYDYLHADRFGFMMGIDDLFWRSLVWAARKPFVLRGYPRLFAIQQDDPATGWPSRVVDMFNPALTGNVAADGTGGPWKVTGFIQTAEFADNVTERQALMSLLTGSSSAYLKVAPHTVTGGSGGDLYWSGDNSAPLTDSQWLTNYNDLLTFQQGNGPTGGLNGGTDVIPFSSSLVPHFWDLSNNTGWDIWNLGIRYITEIQKPGVYYSQVPAKAPNQRIPFRPFRIYEQPPTNANPNETWPIYYADDYTVGSRAGLPSRTFFAFATQLQGAGYPSFDAKWPQAANGIPMNVAVENWEAYAWRFWSGLAPVQIYNHDGGSMANSTDQERQQFISTVSQWLAAHGSRNTFMENMGAYMHARVKSNLTGGQADPSTITLNFSGNATDMNGAPVTTSALVFYGDNSGSPVNVPGFTTGTSISFPNVTPPGLALDTSSLAFGALPGGANPPSQSIQVSNSGAGTLSWTASDNASWLSLSPASGTNAGTITASVNIAGLAEGTYTATIVVSATGATNSPQSVSVTLVIAGPNLGVSPSALVFNGFQGQPNPAPDTLMISNLGGGTINWTASSTGSWLSLSTLLGTAPSNVTTQADITGLAIGTYSGSVTITASGAKNSPQTIPVTLSVAGLLASSNFDDGTMQGWAISPLGLAQNWSVSNGSLGYNGGGHTQVYAGDASWTDYDLFTDVKLATLADYPGGIRGRVNPATGASYALWLYPNEKIVRLYRTVTWNIDAGFTLLGQASFAFDTTNFHTLKLSFKGSTIQAFIDGISLIAVTDTTLTSGMVALDVSNRVINFDNVFISGSVLTPNSISASPTSMSFAAQAGGASPAAQSLQLASTGGALAWTASGNAPWLTLSATSGVTPVTLSVSANTLGLASGTYNATIQVVSKGAQNGQISIPVTLVVSPQPVILVASPASFSFLGATTLDPLAQTLNITNGGGGAMTWTASTDASWLSVTPASGSAPSTATVTATSTGLAVGQYTGNVILSSPDAGNSPLLLPATMRVGDLLFADDFSSGNANNWFISPLGLAANWSVVNGAYVYNGGGHTQSYTGNPAWTDYSFSTDIKLASTSNFPGGFRARVNLNTGGGYGVWLYPGNGLIKLFSIGQWNIDGGSLSLVAQAPYAFDTNVHNYRIDLQGSDIRVFVDNVQVIQVTDTTFTSGVIALDVSNQPIQYDNIKVISF